MRLIGKVENEKQAFVVYSYLLEQGVHSTYEKEIDPETQKEVVSIWIYEENSIELAQELLAEYKANPKAEKFANIQFPEVPPQAPDLIAEAKEEEGVKKESVERKKKNRSYPLTYGVILICVLLYFWNSMQQYTMYKGDGKLALQLGMTPVQQKLMFDYPESNQEIDALLLKYPLSSVKDLKSLPPEELSQFAKAQSIPTWKGFLGDLMARFKDKPDPNKDAPMFVKIGEGQVWRLFTPCLLHGGLLHILFNMAWAWLLLKQVEERLSKFKVISLIVIIAIIANISQYMVSGPYFLGFSGVVCGLVGFIWMRQRVAPWEGYPLHRSTIIFILVFVGAMFALELVSLFTALLTAKEITANIANTAHIIGGLSGILLGRIPFFSRGMN